MSPSCVGSWFFADQWYGGRERRELIKVKYRGRNGAFDPANLIKFDGSPSPIVRSQGVISSGFYIPKRIELI
jgi:hypothetical protein